MISNSAAEDFKMTRSERFAYEQKLAMDCRPRIYVHATQVQETADGKGYAIRIEGNNLHAAIVPPKVTVGGEIVADLKFSGDGRSISGTVGKKPRDSHTIVDYGFARGELK